MRRNTKRLILWVLVIAVLGLLCLGATAETVSKISEVSASPSAGTVTVRYQSDTDGELEITVLRDDDKQTLFDRKNVPAPATDGEARTLTVRFASLPDYFVVHARLLDGTDAPSPVFEENYYTRDIQTVIHSKPSDYDPERTVRLFTDGGTDSFFVLREGGVVLHSSDGVRMTAGNNGTVLFSGPADQLAKITADAPVCFVDDERRQYNTEGLCLLDPKTRDYEDGDHGWWEYRLVYPKKVTSNDYGVTVTDGLGETSEEDLFEVALLTDGLSGSKTFVKEVQIGLSGGINIHADLTVTFDYTLALFSRKKCLKLVTTVEMKDMSISVGADVSVDVTLLTIPIGIPKLMDAELGISLGLEVTGSFDVLFDTKVRVGFETDFSSGQDLSEAPKFKYDTLNVNGEASVTLSFGPSVNALFIISAGADAYAGFYVRGTLCGDEGGDVAYGDDEWHVCERLKCLQGDYGWKSGGEVYAKVGSRKWSKTLTENRLSMDHFYHTWSFDEGGTGDCPYYAYRLDVTVRKVSGPAITLIKDATVTLLDPPSDRHKSKSEAKTDSNGKASVYIPEGKQQIRVSFKDPETGMDCSKTVDVVMENAAQTMMVDFIPDSVRLHFEPNSANIVTGLPADLSCFRYETVTIPAAEPATSGQRFNGWSLEPDGPVAYLPGDSVKLTADETRLYANWSLLSDCFYVLFDLQGGNDGPPAMILEKNEKWAILPEKIPTRGDDLFRGWGKIPDVTEGLIQPGNLILLDGTTFTLYAIWEPAPGWYHVRFDANGGTGAPEPVSGQEGKVLTLPDTMPQNPGWFFLGWAEDPDDPAAVFMPGDEMMVGPRDITLYAIWSMQPVDICTIRFDANGGQNPPRDMKVLAGTTVSMPTRIPENPGSLFLGWAEGMTGMDPVVYPGDAYVAEKDVTFYAVWEILPVIPCRITFDANGGENAPKPITGAPGTTVLLPLSEPTNMGWTFLGWGTDPMDPGYLYLPGTAYLLEKNCILYAYWVTNPVDYASLTYDANGGINAPATQYAAVNGRLVLSNMIPQRPGWTFVEWGNKASEPDNLMLPGQQIVLKQDTILYAAWKQEYRRYRIIFGAGSFWEKKGDLRFMANGELEDFIGAEIDGKPVDNSHYFLSRGSTILDLKESYLKTLSLGRHTIVMKYKDGKTNAAVFTVLNHLPPTGDTGRPFTWLCLLTLSVIACVMLNKKRRIDGSRSN